MRYVVRSLVAALLLAPGLAVAQPPDPCVLNPARARNNRLVAPTVDGVALPSALLTVGSDCFDLSDFIRLDGKLYRLQLQGTTFGGAMVNLDVLMDPDPGIGFALGVTNLLAAPLTVGFSFITPVVAATYVSARSRLSATVTDFDIALGGASVGAPLGAPLLDGLGGGPFVTLGVPRGIMPTNGPVPCVVGAGVGTTTCNYGLVTAPIAPSAFTLLRADVGFVLSPGDLASMSGAVEIFPAVVPEPASMSLLGTGILALGGVVLRRRQRRM